jgi:hypothetical protein
VTSTFTLGVRDLLEVVHDEEKRPLGQMRAQERVEWLRAALAEPESLRDRRQHEVRVLHRRQEHDERPVLELLQQLGRRLERKARLARPARP